MQQTMAQLDQISLTELESAPLAEETKSRIIQFLKQCKGDFNRLPLKTHDPIIAAELLLKGIFESSPHRNQEAFKEAAKKVEQIFEILDSDRIDQFKESDREGLDMMGLEGKVLLELYQATDTLAKRTSVQMKAEIVEQGLARHINYIKAAVKKQEPAEVNKEYLDFKNFLQEQYPGASREDIKVILSRDVQALPENILQTIDMAFDYSDRAATPIIMTLTAEVDSCLRHLTETIVAEIKNLPDGGDQYNFGSTGEEITIQNVDINRLLYDCASNKDEKNLPKELQVAAQSYHALRQLDDVLKEDKKPLDKLTNFRDKFLQPEIHTALQANPDNKVVSLFKKIGYTLAYIFTGGNVDLEKKSVIVEKQNLVKGAVQALRAAEATGTLTSLEKPDTPKPK